jgi:tRNA pseudouridine38-40 synthase
MAGHVIRLCVAYDGRGFHGSQRQGNARSVQAELERAAQEFYKVSIPIYLAGRTDRGVHAAAQVASFAEPWPPRQEAIIGRALNAHLPEDVSIIGITRESLGFHARYSAKWREYRYRIYTGSEHPLVRGFVWFRTSDLQLDAMNEACQRIMGTHDFASFAAGGEGVPWAPTKKGRGSIRSVYHCSARIIQPWWGPAPHAGDVFELRIVADGFLPRMVRGIIGAVVEVGRRQREPAWMEWLLAQKDRRKAPMNAPPEGLTLWAVGYHDEEPEDLQLSSVIESSRPS